MTCKFRKGCVYAPKHYLNKVQIKQPQHSRGKCEGGGRKRIKMKIKISRIQKSDPSAPLAGQGVSFLVLCNNFFFRSYSFLIFICFVRPFGKSTCYVSHPILAVSSENQAPFSGRPKLIGSSNECSPGWLNVSSQRIFISSENYWGTKNLFFSPPPLSYFLHYYADRDWIHIAVV